MMTPTIDESALVRPIPPRYWWLKRIMIGTGVLLLAVLALRLWWGWEAHRRFQAEIDKLIAAGEPIFPEDFNPKQPIPDEENAAKLYLEAASILKLTDDDREFLGDEFLRARKPSAKELYRVRAILEDYREALDLIRRARDLPKVDWGYRFSSPAILNSIQDHLGGQRNISRILAAATGYYDAIGEPLEAVATLHDAFYHAQAIDRAPTLIGHLVAMGCFAMQHHAIESYAPSVEMIRVAELSGQSGLTLRMELTHLKDELQNETALRASFQQQLRCDAMFTLDLALAFERGELTASNLLVLPASEPSLWERIVAFPFVPLIWSDATRTISMRSSLLEAAGAPNVASARRILNAWSVKPKMTKSSVVSPAIWWDSRTSNIRQYFRYLAIRRMAATALAIRLYEVDHGRRPETLDELVPDYLLAVPLDPLAEGDRPIGYLPRAERPILYSVGEDGIDHGGRYKVFDNGEVGRRDYDWPFFLDGPPEKHAPPSEGSVPEQGEAIEPDDSG